MERPGTRYTVPFEARKMLQNLKGSFVKSMGSGGFFLQRPSRGVVTNLYNVFRQYTTIYQYSDIIYTVRSHYGNMFRP